MAVLTTREKSWVKAMNPVTEQVDLHGRMSRLDTDGKVITGTQTFRISLKAVYGPTGIQLPAAAASNVLGFVLGTYGSAVPIIRGTGAGSATDVGHLTLVLPPDYVAGTNVTLIFRAKMSGAPSTSGKLDCEAFLSGNEGAVSGTDICATGIQTLTTSFANYTFTLTGTTLTANASVDVRISTVTVDTGTVYAIIGGITGTMQRAL